MLQLEAPDSYPPCMSERHLLGLGLPLAGHGELRGRGRQGLVLGWPVATVREVVLQRCQG